MIALQDDEMTQWFQLCLSAVYQRGVEDKIIGNMRLIKEVS